MRDLLKQYEPYRKDLDFIDQFCDAENSAAGSKVDPNSNVSGHNIATLAPEIHKQSNVFANRLRMHDTLKEMFGEELADQYLEDLENHILYRHDEAGMPVGTPYTYSANEAVVVKTPHGIRLVSLETLYDKCDTPELMVDEDNMVFQKYPDDYYIVDRCGLTKITTLTKKKRHRDLVIVKTKYGENVIVTDNHPMIIDDDVNTVPAADSLGKVQYRVPSDCIVPKDRTVKTDLSIPTGERYRYYTLYKNGNYHYVSLPNYKMDENLGYFIGFFIAEGWFKTDGRNENNIQMIIKVKGDTDLHACADALFLSTGIASTVSTYTDSRGMKTLTVCNPDFVRFCKETLDLGTSAPVKKLPCTIFEYGDDFARGVIEGLVDGDGTYHHGRFTIRLASRTCISQLSAVLHYLGVPASMSYSDRAEIEGSMIQSSYPMFSIEFPACELFSKSRKYRADEQQKFSKYQPDGYVDIINVIPVENKYFLNDNNFIYDITTESHTFVMNALWVHNCVAVSLWPFLVNGTEIMHDKSSAPKNLNAFTGAFINLVFSIAGQFAGAVATGSFFTVFAYYCILEWGEDFYLHPDKVVYHTVNKDKTILDQIKQEYQHVTYSLNSPSGNRNGQSVFWNVSAFDKNYFMSVFDNVWFPDGMKVTDIWPQVKFIQETYMMWLNKEREKCILTFPVESFSLLHDGKDFVDKESADFVAKMHGDGHSFFVYSSDSVDSLASCCYSGDTLVKVCERHGESVVLRFDELPLHPELMMDDDTFNVWCLNGYRHGKLIIMPNRKMYEVKLENGAVLRMTDNHRNLVFDNNHHEVGPVLTENLAPGEHAYICGDEISFSYVKIVSVEPYDYDGYVWCFEMVGDDKFALANGVYNYNCRLRNAIDEEKNTFSYTLGAGGIATGSKCVMTLNLNRLTQNAMRKKYNFESGHVDEVRDPAKLDENLDAICAEVRKEVKKVHKYLLAFEKIMKDMLDKHMLSTYDAGFISPEKQFLTVGGNGTNQAAQYLGLTINDNPEYKKFIQRIFSTISEVDKEDRDKEHGIKFNFELVPRQ